MRDSLTFALVVSKYDEMCDVAKQKRDGGEAVPKKRGHVLPLPGLPGLLPCQNQRGSSTSIGVNFITLGFPLK